MKRINYLLLFLLCIISANAQKNLTLLANYTFAPGVTCAGVWHYNDNANHEYALVGTSNGLSIIDITNTDSLKDIFDVPDTIGLWREVKTWSHYAYMTNEGVPGNGGGGITIIDLSNLPAAPIYKKYTGDGSIAGNISTAHTVQADSGFLYLNGCRRSDGNNTKDGGGTIICSLADPWNPVYVGIADSLNYVHDCFVRGNLLVTSQIFANPSGFALVDITDKAHPADIISHRTPGNFNHNAWMSDDSHYLYTTDEKNRAPLASFEISNYLNIEDLDLYLTNKNPIGEVHNVRVLNDFLVNACYGDSVYTGSQVTLVDAARPGNLIEVGDYQLCPPATGLMISWDADPYLPSGNLLATEGHHGLFVFAPTYIRACYLEGLVADSISGLPLNDAKVEILSTIAQTNASASGTYQTGVADSGTYDVRYSLAGYITKTITGVVLKNGVLTTLNVKLLSATNGINEKTTADNLINIYPNPSRHDVTVSIQPSLINNEQLRLIITDVAGRKVKEITCIKESTITLDRRGITNGSYNLLLLDGKTKIAESKLILQ